MLGYKIALSAGASQVVEGSSYVVGDDGALVVLADAQLVQRWDAGEWLAVEDVGVRLSTEWPAPQLPSLLEELKYLLAVTYGHYVHLIGGADKYSLGVLNELDALAGIVLTAAHISPDDKSRRAEISEVRAAIGKAFNADVPTTWLQPSGWATEMRCPRCGDALLQLGDGRLLCLLGDMEISVAAADAIKDYCESEPKLIAKRSASARVSERWCCPVDGRINLVLDGRLPKCATCGRVLPDGLVQELMQPGAHL